GASIDHGAIRVVRAEVLVGVAVVAVPEEAIRAMRAIPTAALRVRTAVALETAIERPVVAADAWPLRRRPRTEGRSERIAVLTLAAISIREALIVNALVLELCVVYGDGFAMAIPSVSAFLV